MSKCGAETEVYSRVVGYHRPVKNWNKGKREEFKDRKIFALPPSSSAAVLFLMTFLLITSAGCSTANSAIRSASGKNVSADGFLSYQSITTGAMENSPTPSVHLVTGSLVEVTTSSDDPSYFLLVWNVATILQHLLFCKW